MVILWDFYDTIAAHRGTKGGWSACVWELLHEFRYTDVTIDQVRPFLADCFPWNHPTLTHTDFFQGMEWWEKMNLEFERIFIKLGAGIGDAAIMASLVRAKYSDADKWMIYPDAIETLERMIVEGNRNYIVSNFFPEIAPLIEDLRLTRYFERIYTSGHIGFEKPHPEFYKHILSDLNISPSDALMIGDNYKADIAGANEIGIKAILVHAENIQTYPFYSKDLKGIFDFL